MKIDKRVRLMCNKPFSTCFQGIHLLTRCPEGMGFKITKPGMGECDLIDRVENCEHKAWNLIN